MKLEDWMEENNFTIKTLSEKLGMSYSHVYKVVKKPYAAGNYFISKVSLLTKGQVTKLDF